MNKTPKKRSYPRRLRPATPKKHVVKALTAKELEQGIGATQSDMKTVRKILGELNLIGLNKC